MSIDRHELLQNHRVSAQISFSDDVATVVVDGEWNVWLASVGFVAAVVGTVLFFKIDILLFTIFGWLLVVLLPFGFYEFLKGAPNLSYEFVIHRKGQLVGRTNVGQGYVSRKTGEFIDVRVLTTHTLGEWPARLSYVQVTCEQGVFVIDTHLSHASAIQIAASLAPWLGVKLMPPAEIPFLTAARARYLLPRYNPWK